VTENTGTPDQIRAYVRKMKADGADLIKLFATASIRDGGKQTMTDEQIQATCGEAKALGAASRRACACARRCAGGGDGWMHVHRAWRFSR
jgi:hypothetical protein